MYSQIIFKAENKKLLKKKRKKEKIRCTWANRKSFQFPKLKQFDQENKDVVLGYNQKYKINIHELLLINKW